MAFLPEAKKPFNLKAAHQPELDIHDIASKADVYNIGTSPKVIEEGMTAGMELIYYLAADGFKTMRNEELGMRNKERCRQAPRESFNNPLLFLIPNSSFLIFQRGTMGGVFSVFDRRGEKR